MADDSVGEAVDRILRGNGGEEYLSVMRIHDLVSSEIIDETDVLKLKENVYESISQNEKLTDLVRSYRRSHASARSARAQQFDIIRREILKSSSFRTLEAKVRAKIQNADIHKELESIAQSAFNATKFAKSSSREEALNGQNNQHKAPASSSTPPTSASKANEEGKNATSNALLDMLNARMSSGSKNNKKQPRLAFVSSPADQKPN
eukprot:CAMPEP_0182449398 /NCGR_PEP_ID=MMETSP1172-20130603/34052_1 /TAXON_ID=708627 /ORGANISM="Timspurckia oligopyrenoides, Strain CCMP3278" /LENGTH=205 /DNA_ID=CAMNT_0024646667 /DNA_START=45 /DNA_END=662 /DNA_ORIENTATION=-